MPRGSNFKRPYSAEFRREAVELYRRGGQPLEGQWARDLARTAILAKWPTPVEVGLRDG
jgi:transposase-like protein